MCAMERRDEVAPELWRVKPMTWLSMGMTLALYSSTRRQGRPATGLLALS